MDPLLKFRRNSDKHLTTVLRLLLLHLGRLLLQFVAPLLCEIQLCEWFRRNRRFWSHLVISRNFDYFFADLRNAHEFALFARFFPGPRAPVFAALLRPLPRARAGDTESGR